jgi:ATP-dependent DNA helicase DinG
MDVDAFFHASGPLAACLARYERREPQIAMARAVERVVRETGVLLAEAGTGTGKTLAYLAPAALAEKRTVVSTGTRNLQEQIFFKDLALLGEALGRPVDAALLKGQENYLCLRRLADLLRSPAVLGFPPREIERLVEWSNATATGDRAEVAWLADESPLWREVCSTAETRIGQRCPAFDRCFVTRARLDAQRAALVVVNHHLYFADLATRAKGSGGVLPRHDVVVFDEAHLIEDVATEFFSVKVSSGRVDRMLDDVVKVVAGALRDAEIKARHEKLCQRARRAAARFFSGFRHLDPGRTRLDFREAKPAAHEAYHKLDAALDAVESSLRGLGAADEAVDHAAERCRTARAELGEVLEGRDGGASVRWVEVKPRSIAVGASPIDVAGPFRDGVLFRIPSAVLTSATLSTGGDFAFLRSRLGIDFDAGELSFPAPFDYGRQARLYVPAHLPDPRDDGFFAAAVEEALALIAITGGGALVLSTSIRGMLALHRGFGGRVPGPLYVQGDAPKSALLAEFVRDPASVLVATTSFWQGVDVAGDALRLVVIDKLPFASPQDPITEARIRRIEETGGSAFSEYQVPQAALALKQGFGRLIRTRYDRGVVAVLDRRLWTKGYGKVLLRSLPPCPTSAGLDGLAAWWRGEPGADEGAVSPPSSRPRRSR